MSSATRAPGRTLVRFRTHLALAGAALASHACGGARFDSKLPEREFRAAMVEQIAGVSLDGAFADGDVKKLAMAETARLSSCEVLLTLKTWDGIVFSEKVCIKEAGKGVAIPSRIALNVKPGKEVAKRRYCEQKRNDGLCVWNRQYYDRYPFSFVFETQDKTPMAQHLSLIRILRNGKAVYTWDPGHAPADTTRVVVAARSIVQPDYFKEPVDLGLYVLPSGVEKAQAAAAQTYSNSRRALGEVLETAAERAVRTTIPDVVRADFQCLKDRLEYVRAVIGDDEAAKAAAQARIEAAAKSAGSRNAAAAAARPVTVATEEGLDEARAPATVDGVKLAAGDSVLFLDRDGARGRVRIFAKAGAAWGKMSDQDVQAITPVEGTNDRFVTITSGTRAGRSYELSAWTTGDAYPPIQGAVKSRHVCTPPKDVLEKANDALEKVVADAAKKGRDAVVGAVAEKSRALAKEVANALDAARRDLDAAMNELPPELRARLGDNLVWMRSVDDAAAQILEAIRTFQAVGPEMEAQVVSNLKDPAVQLRAYNEFVRSLPSDESIWAGSVANPAAGPDEGTLDMTFRRPRQFYAFLAWNAVPLPVTKAAHVKVTPKVDNLIPIIDVVGWYWQTGSGLIPTTGFGIGAIGTREEIEKPSYVTAFNIGAQANFSVSGFRLGVAHMIRQADSCDEDNMFMDCYVHKNNLRVLVGADLIRLFTGKDTAAFQTTSGASSDTD